MKKFGKMALVAVAALAVVSCNNEPKDNATASNDGKSLASGKIAYVVMDSINNQYAFAKDCEKILKEKEANIEKTLSGKQQTLQAAAANFQKKYQSNGFSSQDEFNRTQAALQKQGEDLEALRQRLLGEYQQEQVKYLKALNDSVDHFLAVYNKDKKYDFILTKEAVLYAAQSNDITKEVIAGLNKAYKGMKATAEEKK